MERMGTYGGFLFLLIVVVTLCTHGSVFSMRDESVQKEFTGAILNQEVGKVFQLLKENNGTIPERAIEKSINKGSSEVLSLLIAWGGSVNSVVGKEKMVPPLFCLSKCMEDINSSDHSKNSENNFFSCFTKLLMVGAPVTGVKEKVSILEKMGNKEKIGKLLQKVALLTTYVQMIDTLKIKDEWSEKLINFLSGNSSIDTGGFLSLFEVGLFRSCVLKKADRYTHMFDNFLTIKEKKYEDVREQLLLSKLRKDFLVQDIVKRYRDILTKNDASKDSRVWSAYLLALLVREKVCLDINIASDIKERDLLPQAMISSVFGIKHKVVKKLISEEQNVRSPLKMIKDFLKRCECSCRSSTWAEL
ncbi:MAG: hypothetical protein JW725_04410 [Candidatus Babeliaceae bacterium]|nr:hypothetical protein [Candidatus Babeliaceae bacterium]